MIERERVNGADTADVSPVDRLARRVEQCLGRAAEREFASPRIRRVAVEVEDVDPLAWLQHVPAAQKVYWSGRDAGWELAGVGCADSCTAADPSTTLEGLCRDLLPRLQAADVGVRYVGGARFDSAGERDARWSSFGAYRFVVPRFEIRREEDATWLACNLVLPRDGRHRTSIMRAVRALPEPSASVRHRLSLPVARTDRPDRPEWERMVRRALSAFEEGRMDKVVLARTATFEMDEPLDSVALLEQLRAVTSDCFHFLVQPEPGTAFVGASPERLFEREGRRVRSEAVAGTRPRGGSARDDARLRDELLASDKDRREHEFVRRSIEERLAPLCQSLSVEGEPSEMKLTRGRHLVSHVEGRLRDDVTSLDVLQQLHPTPAVGGYPRAEAMQAIRDQEPFDRGWYAGPVGWIGRDGADVAVGIRSGLIHGRQLSLYSGAGIVIGSTPDGEWEEIEQKLRDFTDVLGLVPQHSI